MYYFIIKLFIEGKNIYIKNVNILKKLTTAKYYFLITHWKTLENYII